MQYLLTQEERNGLVPCEQLTEQKDISNALRRKVFQVSGKKCFKDLTADERRKTYVDEGYCDSCPLSFCKNEDEEMKYEMCGQKGALYSK